MNSIKSTQINLVHLCLLDINLNPDYSGPIQIQIHFLRKKPERNGLVHLLDINLNPDYSGPIQIQIHFLRKKPERNGLVLSTCLYKLLSKEPKDALQKYNVEAIQKCKSSRILHGTNFVHGLHEETQDNSPSSSEDDEFQECQEYHPDQDLEPPSDDLLDFISSQEHSDDQLDQVLQTYQTYQESQSESQPPTRQLNAHITCHVAQAN